MKDILKKLAIVLLALGLMGIILGISVGLYRNDALARMQAMGMEVDSAGQESGSDDAAGGSNPEENDTLDDVLLWGNLHTILLGAGMILSILSVVLFLIGLRKTVE